MNPDERRRHEDAVMAELEIKYGLPGYYECDIDVMKYLELQYAKKGGARQETFRKRTG
jgi:hypothetical protein